MEKLTNKDLPDDIKQELNDFSKYVWKKTQSLHKILLCPRIENYYLINNEDQSLTIDIHVSEINDQAEELIEKYKHSQYYSDIYNFMTKNLYIDLSNINFSSDFPLFSEIGWNTILVGIKLENCVFKKKIRFIENFKGNICFNETIFEENVEFKGMNFFDNLSMDKCTFKNDITFKKVKFHGTKCNLRRSNFEGLLMFEKCRFENSAPDLRGTKGPIHLNFDDTNKIKEPQKIDIDILKSIQKTLKTQGSVWQARVIHNYEISSRVATILKNDLKDILLLKKPDNLLYLISAEVYRLINNRGTSIAIPLIWLIFGTYIMSLFYQDFVIIDPDILKNIKKVVTDPNILKNIKVHEHPIWINDVIDLPIKRQAILYSIQTTLWPIRILSDFHVLTLSSLHAKIYSVLHSIFATIIWYLFITGLKARFKIEGLK